MKDQYFGDVNDFRKYGLLRVLVIKARLRLGVCWMRTDSDGGTDGRFLDYLNEPAKCRHRDPELFDWLKQVVGDQHDRRTARIEASSLLGGAVFQSCILTDSATDRRSYFHDCAARFDGPDLVFFDPDNGIEVKSRPRGHKDSSKFLYWDEIFPFWNRGSSLLIYQHFPRQNREDYTANLASRLQQRIQSAAVFCFRTANVLFLLASQARHANHFRECLDQVRAAWHPDIVGSEYAFSRSENRSDEFSIEMVEEPAGLLFQQYDTEESGQS